MELEILQIDWTSTLPIRHEVLWPNKEIKFCHVIGDKEALHFGAKFEEKLISVASVYINDNEARLRKFATIQDYQKRGVGSKLFSFILSTIKRHEITYFWCDARESAVGFYTKFGLKPEGSRFYKSGIPYYKMSQTINNKPLSAI